MAALTETTDLFFRLVRVALGRAESLPATPNKAQWADLLRMAREQTLAGVLFAGVERLPAGQRPPREVLMQWFALAEQIRRTNQRLNREAARATERFGRDGFRSVVLKGQGCALLYPDPLLRTPGDIDIWLEGGRKRILAYTRRFFPHEPVRYHHVDFPALPGIGIEVHFTPSWMNRYGSHQRLQGYFRREAARQFAHRVQLPGEAGAIGVPTADFNRIYLLVHIYRHLFGEGIGLRQMLDYYYLLRTGTTEAERRATMERLGALRMVRFARATMYVMQEVFDLEEEFLLCRPDKRAGRFLLDEIMQAGNFGKYDKRLARHADETALFRFCRSLRRNLRFVRDYPSEVLWDPPFKIWLYAWRLWHGYMGR